MGCMHSTDNTNTFDVDRFRSEALKASGQVKQQIQRQLTKATRQITQVVVDDNTDKEGKEDKEGKGDKENREDHTHIVKLLQMSEDEMYDVDETDYTDMTMAVRMVDIYDGDTFTCLFWDPYMKRYNKKRCRSNGINAPEMHPKLNAKHRNRQIRWANAAKDALVAWANAPNCIYVCTTQGEREKFGRLLVEIYRMPVGSVKGDPFTMGNDIHDILDQRDSMSEYMLANTKSKKYDGGKKEDW